jgi:uncharacterized protein YndB with AHSA1/START domain
MIDVKQQISAVRRTLGSRELAAGEARVLTISQAYDTDLDDLWDAVTNVERIPRWFLPITGDLRLGGRYQFEGNAGGVVERCDQPNSFAATWEYGGDVSWIEARLTPEGDGRARFELEHVAHVDDERWTEYGPGAVGVGWDSGLLGLSQHFRTAGPALEPKAAMAWMQSGEGKLFVTLSSDSWYDANVAAGAEESAARAAADRCTAAYTGS